MKKLFLTLTMVAATFCGMAQSTQQRVIIQTSALHRQLATNETIGALLQAMLLPASITNLSANGTFGGTNGSVVWWVLNGNISSTNSTTHEAYFISANGGFHQWQSNGVETVITNGSFAITSNGVPFGTVSVSNFVGFLNGVSYDAFNTNNASTLSSGTIPLARLAGITSNQMANVNGSQVVGSVASAVVADTATSAVAAGGATNLVFGPRLTNSVFMPRMYHARTDQWINVTAGSWTISGNAGVFSNFHRGYSIQWDGSGSIFGQLNIVQILNPSNAIVIGTAGANSFTVSATTNWFYSDNDSEFLDENGNLYGTIVDGGGGLNIGFGNDATFLPTYYTQGSNSFTFGVNSAGGVFWESILGNTFANFNNKAPARSLFMYPNGRVGFSVGLTNTSDSSFLPVYSRMRSAQGFWELSDYATNVSVFAKGHLDPVQIPPGATLNGGDGGSFHLSIVGGTFTNAVRGTRIHDGTAGWFTVRSYVNSTNVLVYEFAGTFSGHAFDSIDQPPGYFESTSSSLNSAVIDGEGRLIVDSANTGDPNLILGNMSGTAWAFIVGTTNQNNSYLGILNIGIGTPFTMDGDAGGSPFRLTSDGFKESGNGRIVGTSYASTSVVTNNIQSLAGQFIGNGGGLTNGFQNTITYTNFLIGTVFTNTSTRNVEYNINIRANPTTTGNAMCALVWSPTGAGNAFVTNKIIGLEADTIFTTAPHSWHHGRITLPPAGLFKLVDVTGEGLFMVTNSYSQTLQ